MSKIEVNTVEPQCGTTLTLGGSGDTVTLGSGASQSGFGRTGTVDWITTVQTSGFTAANGKGYFVNTTSGAITVNLPAGSAGDIVAFKDYANTWDTNSVTIVPNGSDKIGGIASQGLLNTESQSVTLVFVDSTKGWLDIHDSTSNVTGSQFVSATGGTVTTVCTNFKVHTFTGPGTFCVSAGNGPKAVIDYLVIAGGGGSVYDRGGGGGAGGYREAKTGCNGSYTASPLANPTGLQITGPVAIPITVGAGGAGDNTPPHCSGNPGSNSVFSTITSAGGGAGNRNNPNNGANGGSGGGGGYAGGNGTGGAGNTPPVSPPQGQSGGDANYPTTAGGGGATAAGQPGSGGKAGGAGATSSINGTPTARAGGGGGIASGTGGTGGGGPGGADCSGGGGTSGTVNTGSGGGGGGSNTNAGDGGSGIVIIRYKFQ